MASDVNKHLTDMVEEKTGYGVSIIVDGSITTHSGMVSASQLSPMHLIKINPKYERLGDYLVALQCAMLLIKWRNPDRIPDFIVHEDKVNSLIESFSNQAITKGVPSNIASEYGRMMVIGILQQLNSIPIQMLSMEMLKDLCPGLQDLQKEAVNNELQESSSTFSKKVQEITPKIIFDQNVTMNAAYAIRWSQISGNKSILLPYNSLGYTKRGKLLLDIYGSLVKKRDPDRYTEIVDGWAAVLNMNDWYEWRYRKGGSNG
jgi:hypothetical protein